MSGIFLRWGVPAFVTVIGGTAAAIATSGSAIPPDLQSRAQAVLADPQDDWATLSFDMRDATITGTATTQAMIDAAIAKVAAVHGVRSVTSNVVLAEYVSPFPLIATVNGGVVTLTGGIPDEAARAEILAVAGEGVRDETRPMSGAPNRTSWIAAAKYALGYARQLDEGEVALADLDLTISGRARSAEAYEALEGSAGAVVPASVKVAYREVQPALRSPFEWHAAYDGRRLTMSGATPSNELVRELEALAPAGTVSTSLVLASGAPVEFAASAKLLVQNLLKLESGSADISDGTSTLTGSPADTSIAEAVRVAMTPSGAAVTLGPPQVAEYWLSAERGPGGIVLDGFVPDAALRDRLEALDNVDAAGLELGRGAPERFESGVDFVIETLRRMSEGHAAIQGTVISVEGRAATVADFTAIETRLELGAPQGLILASTTIKPPLATPFTFAAEMTASGQFLLSGYVPSAAVRKALLGKLPAATDTMVVADGNPADFEAAAVKALGVLALLDSGKVSYDGASWSLSGAVDTPQEAFAAESAFASTGLRAAGWTYAVSLPEAAKVAALPVVDPYVWRAQKSSNGTVTFGGFVPTEQLKRYLSGHAGTAVVDGTTLGAGAPDGFIASSIAGLDALLAMDEGTLALSAGNWSLTGKLPTTTARYAVEAGLRTATDTSTWHVAIQAADAAPVVTPFVWSAIKAADGSVSLSGYVPTEQVRRFAAVRAGKVASDTTLVGSGEPQGFIPDVLAGLDALLRLESGEVRYDSKGWSLSGQPLTTADAEAATAALAAASDGGAGWSQALAAPTQQAATEAAPAVEAVAEAPAEAVAEQPAEPTDQPSEAAAADAPVAELSAPAPVEDAAPATEPAVEATPAPAPQPAEDVAAAAPEATAVEPAVRNYRFDARKARGGTVVFSGAVPAEPMRRHLAVIAGEEPSDSLAINPDLPADFIVSADAGSRALTLLADGEFGLDGDRWVFIGRAETEQAKQAALTALAAVPSLDQWQTSVTLLPPLDICRDKVGALAARNAITFQSGSARMAEESLPVIDELAGDLALCPEATVNVEGHTDSDGEDEANLALSVSRAEAVVDALILRGIGPERLYAIGYGESLPVASNETRAGKQANRRIVFTLADE